MKHTGKNADLGLLVLRVAVGLIFVIQGWGKLNGIDGVTGMLANIGFPAAGFFAWLLAATEFLGGLALILGVYIRVAAKLLAFVMVVALLTMHLSGPFSAAMAPVAILGGSIALMFLGGGNWQLMKKNEDFAWCKICK